MSTKKEYLTDYIQLKAITAILTNNSQFSYSKTGFIRFFRDWTKRSYVLEILKEKDQKNAPLLINVISLRFSNIQQQL